MSFHSQSRPQINSILLVDNKEDNLSLMLNLLKREGYNVITALDAQAALRIIRQSPPDLLISQIRLKELNGIELTRLIKAESTGSYLPVILISSNQDLNYKIKALESGADECLMKPVRPQELLARIGSLLQLKKNYDKVNESRNEYARLLREAQIRSEELITLNETSLDLGGQISLEELLQLVLTKSCKMARAYGALIYLCDSISQTLTIHAEFNISPSFIGETYDYGQGIAGKVAKLNTLIQVDNCSEGGGLAQDLCNNQVERAVLGIPLINSGQLLAVLELYSEKDNRNFSPDDIQVLNLFAPQAASAIGNKLLYDELSRQHNFVNSVLNSVNDGILMLDADFKVALCNPRFTEILKLKAEHILGMEIREVAALLDEIVESSPPFSPENIGRFIRNLKRNSDRTLTQKFDISDPKRRTIEWSTWPVRGQENNIRGWLNVFRDTSQQRELEQLRDDFTHMLVHDLRNPLTGVISGLELALTPASEGGPQPHHLEYLLTTIKRNSYVLLDMINELLEVNRLEAGKLSLNLETIQLKELVESCLVQISMAAQEKLISIYPVLPDEETLIKVDPEKMRRLIVNLISNAIKFSPSGSKIEIKAAIEEGVRRRGNTASLDNNNLRSTTTQFLRERFREGPLPKALLLTVSDDGPGIPSHSLERIFEKFTQAGGKQREKQGFGLGLTRAKLVSEAHGGRIWAESLENEGSTFFVSIPCVINSPAPAR